MRADEKEIAIFTAYEDQEPYDTARPEKSLLLALLLNALSDLNKKGEPKRKATEFFMSEEEDYIFSFKTICSYLSIDPEKVLIFAGLEKKAR